MESIHLDRELLKFLAVGLGELRSPKAHRDTGRSINGSCLELLEPVWKAFTLTVSC